MFNWQIMNKPVTVTQLVVIKLEVQHSDTADTEELLKFSEMIIKMI